MSSKIKLNGNERNISVGQSPFIGIEAFILVDKLPGEPVIFSFIRIEPLVEFFNPFCIRLPADFYAFNNIERMLWNVYVQKSSDRQSILQNIFSDLMRIFFCRSEIRIE